MGKTTYAKIYLLLPEKLEAGGYRPWANELDLRLTGVEDCAFEGPVEISVSVSTRFEGSLLMLSLWIERWLQERRALTDESRIEAVTVDLTEDCSDIAVCVYDINAQKRLLEKDDACAA